MAVFKCDIPDNHNAMIKNAAKESMQSRQKFIESLIRKAAEKQAAKELKKDLDNK